MAEDEKRFFYVPIKRCVPLEIEVEARSPEEAIAMANDIVSEDGYRNMDEDQLDALSIFFYEVDVEQFHKHLDEGELDDDPYEEIDAIH
jgi:hypothetical protein